jgi:Sel1 repeat protein
MNYKILTLFAFVLICFFLLNRLTKKDNVRSFNGQEVIIVESKRLAQDDKGNNIIVSHWNEDKFNLIKREAESGDIEAQSTLGYLYLTGEFVNENYSKAEYWLNKASEKGDPEAQFNLSYLYKKQNKIDESIKWYRKSAEMNHSEAQLNLALLLGEKEQFDINEIVKLLEKSIQNGNKKAYYPLAYWYLNNLNLNKEKEGLELLKIAVENQDPDAEFTLAELYETGDLVEENLEKSKTLYYKAKDHGSLEAIERLKQDKFK